MGQVLSAGVGCTDRQLLVLVLILYIFSTVKQVSDHGLLGASSLNFPTRSTSLTEGIYTVCFKLILHIAELPPE